MGRGTRDDAPAFRRVFELLGGHPSTALGLDLTRPPDRARWLVAARLLSERLSEDRALEVFRRLDESIGTLPEALARAGPERVGTALEAAGLRRAGGTARSLCRAGAALGGPEGDLEARAAEAWGLMELGEGLASLAPGFGSATILRFLRPLRDLWTTAREAPLAASARAAARHLGLLAESEALEGEPSVLRARCAATAPEIRWLDAESALERLGARACLRGQPARCPLGDACPLRQSARDFAAGRMPALE